MNMITLAARAILKRRYYEPEHHPDLESFYASCYPEHVMEAEAEARAVIEVFRNLPIDRVAKAMAESFTKQGSWDYVGDYDLDSDTICLDGHFSLHPVARAAIDAMFALASPPTPEDAGERT